jgi:hypothetical protein
MGNRRKLGRSKIPNRPEINGLAVPLIVEYLWSNITETPCEGRKRLPRSFEVFGTAYMREWDLSPSMPVKK